MKDKKTIRQRVEVLFGLPAMKMPWSLYMAQLNEAGKITAKSLLDMMTIILESLEEMEEELETLKSSEPEASSEKFVEVDSGESISDSSQPEPEVEPEPQIETTKDEVTKEETPESKPSE